MKKDFKFYLGFITTMFVGVIITPFYAVAITIIRSAIFLWELIWDIITFMPKATYEYERVYLKRMWEEEQERIKQTIDKIKRN